MIVRHPSSYSATSSSIASCSSSVKPPSALSDDWDADEDTMSSGDYQPTNKPLSVSIPPSIGSFCPRRPNLREILANTSPPPWTLAAFMAYLSNNHCLETLEFTMDAGRYRKHYNKMMAKASSESAPPTKDRQYVQDLWSRLVEAYIKPDGTREVNLPSDVRDSILKLPESTIPPAPEKLDIAVAKIYELMEDSVLVPFLNSAYPQIPHPAVSAAPSVYSDDGSSSTISRTTTHSRKSTKAVRKSEPAHSGSQPVAHSYSAPAATFRRSAPSPLMSAASKSRFSSRLTATTSSPAAPAHRGSIAESEPEAPLQYPTTVDRMPGMTDDSASSHSPTADWPSTPPTSPPLSDASPKRDSGMWKKLGRLSGMKAGKKKSQAGLRNTEE